MVAICSGLMNHDDVIKWKHFPRYWPFVKGNPQVTIDSPHKGQWCGALIFSLICAWRNGWANNRDAGDSRRHRVHYNVTVMETSNGLFPHKRLHVRRICGLWLQKYVSRALISNSHSSLMDVITYPCPRYLLLASTFSNHLVCCVSQSRRKHTLKTKRLSIWRLCSLW